MATEQCEEARQGRCSTALKTSRLPARLRRGQYRLAVQIPHPRRRLLFQCRLLRPDREGRDRLAICGCRTFVAEACESTTAETLGADLVVLATGYKGQEHLVRKLFGEAVASRVGPIWGFGEDQELRNMYTRTGQQGLWFIAGSLAQCRSTRSSGAADQGDRRRIAAAGRRPAAEPAAVA